MPDFQKKIHSQREFNSKARRKEQVLFDYESDRGRIINSAAVRRLQQKTQVFPLERNAAVRSRLTHSLEVQQVGRFIVQTIFKQLKKNNALETSGLKDYERHLETLVEMSCLMHDIGNPPFGHFGEAAINVWFENNIDQLYKFNDSDLRRDICQFEGNAQAIRIVHTLQQLNLTYTQVAGIMKYTRMGTEEKPPNQEPLAYLKKKVGFYKSEEHYVERLCTALEINKGHRHPVSYIMEAADDISYCLADLEDAVEKDILSIEELCSALIEEHNAICQTFNLSLNDLDMSDVINYAIESMRDYSPSKESQFFISLRVRCVYPLVKHAADRFIRNLDACFHGSFNQALLEDKSEAHALSQTFKNVAIKHAFCTKEVETRELQGYKIITSLLDIYRPLLSASRADFCKLIDRKRTSLLIASRVFNKLPKKHLKAYLMAVNEQTSNDMEFYYRCRLIQDYITGMTDQFALDEYQSFMALI